MKIVVIIPTYNEKESIGELLEKLCGSVFPSIPHHNLFALVVDGNSPDGTASMVEKIRAHYLNSPLLKGSLPTPPFQGGVPSLRGGVVAAGGIFLLNEKEKRGIGAAYASGMKYAIDTLHADALVEFDGDGQHNPDDIIRLVAEFDRGFDLVIGSRYVAGGSVPREWALWRKFLSRFGSRFAKLVLRLPTNDNTSGFKLTRVKGFAEYLPLEEGALLSRYYAYKIQFLFEMIKRGAKVVEVPIQFREREQGTSKSTLRDVFDSLRVVFILRFKK